jgi:hypothetical protein
MPQRERFGRTTGGQREGNEFKAVGHFVSGCGSNLLQAPGGTADWRKTRGAAHVFHCGPIPRQGAGSRRSNDQAPVFRSNVTCDTPATRRHVRLVALDTTVPKVSPAESRRQFSRKPRIWLRGVRTGGTGVWSCTATRMISLKGLRIPEVADGPMGIAPAWAPAAGTSGARHSGQRREGMHRAVVR